jgi:hypothetical protein
MPLSFSKIRCFSLLIWVVLTLAACSSEIEDRITDDQLVLDYGLLQSLPDEPISFTDEVLPVLENRCIVCHGCYDAPCQLKLSSIEGIRRGASEEKVYNAARRKPMPPTRLGVDAKSIEEWREKGFYPVLNEISETADNPAEQNLEQSVMYQMLRLKQLRPQPRVGVLPETFDLSLDRKQSCPKIETFGDFIAEHPQWGMPYAMPNLSDDEYRTLVQWIAQGSPAPAPAEPSPAAAGQIVQWESFLNGQSNKQRLASRYIYEHLFIGHMRLAGTPDREFYRLVRSHTPPGDPIDVIPSIQPFADPGPGPFYYRLQLRDASIVAKDHVVYELSDARIARYRELFLDPDYEVDELPSYDPQYSSNPFLTFAPIPPNSRYRFLLDDSRYFIQGFIKGPVCRGQVALSVIEDHFWVTFADPDPELYSESPEFLDAAAAHLVSPSETVSTLNLFSIYTRYWGSQKKYLATKEAYLENAQPRDIHDAMNFIWDGEGTNQNAALTVFRNFDSASVEFGLLGDYPETAWVIDYPLLERIHYLLVAGFDVFGNVGHQLNTRLYMDFLRMEGEDHFLLFLPPESRRTIRDTWYEGIRGRRAKLMNEPLNWIDIELVTGYETNDPQTEFYRRIEDHLGPLTSPGEELNRCTALPCDGGETRDVVAKAMSHLSEKRGADLHIFPDTALVRVFGNPDTDDQVFTLILNKGYKNLTSIFSNEDNRERDDDTLSVVRGIIGSYPNFFFHVSPDRIDSFVDDLTNVHSHEDYEQVVAKYGVRRTNVEFWQAADWFQAQYAQLEPVESGILDLNRYRNR